jgi:hypothetical protein
MLVVTANWGFTDGSLVAAAGGSRTARSWLASVRSAVIRAGFGRDGAYRAPETLEIVLAGDTFDCLTSATWQGPARPWHGGARAAAERRHVLGRCARRAAPLLAGLARLIDRGLQVPAADRRGRPAAAVTRQVPVRVAVLTGDRDSCLAEVTPEVTARGGVVTTVWDDGLTLVRHGHEFDPACHLEEPWAAGDRPPTLAESVAVDLVVRFIAGIGGGAARSAALVEALVEARVAEIPAVFAAWRAAGDATAAAAGLPWRDVATAWRRGVDAWVRAARHDPPECGIAASPVETLAAWFAGMAAVPPPRSLGWLVEGGTGVGGGAGTQPVVLGHGGRMVAGGTSICLENAAVRRCCPVAVVRADGAAEAACVAAVPVVTVPATVVGRHDGGRVTWQRIAGAETPEIAPPCVSAIVDAA